MSTIDILSNHPPVRGHAAKRRAIIDAAKRAFVREGVSAASIDAIAVEAGVSRQTVYNQIGDKEKLFAAVMEEITARSAAQFFEVLGTFPDRPNDLYGALVGFGQRLAGRCICDIDGKALSRLIANEGYRYPELFTAWKDYGPNKLWPALAACFAKLAHDGYLDIDDANLAARQFMALINADLPVGAEPCQVPSEEEIASAARNAVTTFLRAFGPRGAYPECVAEVVRERQAQRRGG